MTQYIDKSALVAEIEKYISNYKRILNKVDKSRYDCLDSILSLESKIDVLQHILSFLDTLEVIDVNEEPVSNSLEEACDEYYDETWDEHGGKAMVVDGCHDIWFPSQATDDFFKAGAQWQKENLWKDAQGDDLPEIDREVIALLSNGKVVYAHRPQEYWDGKNITTGEVTRHYPVRHDKGGWNIPDVKFWLDCELFEIEE